MCKPYLKPKISTTHATIQLFTGDPLDYLFYWSENTDSVMWDFGNGNISYEAKPIYTYTEPGVYIVCLTAYNCYGTDTFYREIVVEQFTSINEEVTIELIQIYPIPAQTQIHVKTKTNYTFTNYSIYNLAGKFLKDGVCIDNKIATEFLEDGIYLLQVENYSNGESVMFKFIKSQQ